MKDIVFQFLSSRPTVFYTGWEMKQGILEAYNIMMTDESCTRYSRTLRKSGRIVSRERENKKGKPYTEYSYI